MNYTKSQLEAIHSDQPVTLCLAGPGSGKTRTLIGRIQRLLASGEDPRGIVAITFTNHAADEIQRRLGDVKLGYVGTLHGWCLRVVSRHHDLLKLPSRVSVVDQETSEGMIAEAKEATGYSGRKSDIEDALKRGPFYRSENYTKAEQVAMAFYREQRMSGMISYDTLLHYARESLIRGADLRVEHLLVDEYQDSGDLDAEIYARVRTKTTFYVGDPNQSIYGFRGGNIENIVVLAGCHPPVLLAENFRSSPEICRLANGIIAHNAPKLTFQTKATVEEPGSVELFDYPSAGHEQAEVIRACRDLVTEETAILTRTRHLAVEFYEALQKSGVPVETRSMPDLPADWVKACALVAVANNRDSDAAAYWWLKLMLGKEKADLARTASQMRMTSIAEVVPEHFANCAGMDLQTVARAAARAGLSRETVVKLDELSAKADSLPSLSLAMAAEQEPKITSTGVSVLTVHAAKGREWDNVFLPALEAGVFPSPRGDLYEERRLLYVAVTRARRRVEVSYATRRKHQWGGEREQEPSRFVSEIREAVQ